MTTTCRLYRRRSRPRQLQFRRFRRRDLITGLPRKPVTFSTWRARPLAQPRWLNHYHCRRRRRRSKRRRRRRRVPTFHYRQMRQNVHLLYFRRRRIRSYRPPLSEETISSALLKIPRPSLLVAFAVAAACRHVVVFFLFSLIAPRRFRVRALRSAPARPRRASSSRRLKSHHSAKATDDDDETASRQKISLHADDADRPRRRHTCSSSSRTTRIDGGGGGGGGSLLLPAWLFFSLSLSLSQSVDDDDDVKRSTLKNSCIIIVVGEDFKGSKTRLLECEVSKEHNLVGFQKSQKKKGRVKQREQKKEVKKFEKT